MTALHKRGDRGKTTYACTGIGEPHIQNKQRWAVPGGTAMPGQPVTEVEQAPNAPSISKNQFNILVTLCVTYQMLS